ncbi:MAG: hypothetical protein QOJ52_4302 [Acidimicrobiaceae bacterium]|jgi:hypothetical protein|nr:hypothetical protein [Acidimicrobiaceae bacterium]MDX6621997.1 hypothetical protein [Gaiellales bacterium]
MFRASAAAKLSPETQRGLAAAVCLSRFLAGGGKPCSMPAPIPMLGQEFLYSFQPFSLQEFAGRAVTYNRTWIGVGSPLLFAATLGTSAIFNAARKSEAMAQAAAQWRPINHGTAFLTSRRFGLQGVQGWSDIHFHAIRNSDLAPNEGIVLFLDGVSPLKLTMQWPEYHFILFQFLAYGNVISFEGPPGFELPAVDRPLALMTGNDGDG